MSADETRDLKRMAGTDLDGVPIMVSTQTEFESPKYIRMMGGPLNGEQFGFIMMPSDLKFTFARRGENDMLETITYVINKDCSKGLFANYQRPEGG